ncbi:peptidoglycan editing factor PgeF [Nitrosomonas sp. Nm51]|uniref:peptidoglycan editing factor PgeF n=1 Tax=Nitrosomonas sp. Nm51 TaxID=133720 RepID=UPI003526EE81
MDQTILRITLMIDLITPGWPAPGHIKALFTTRSGGFSNGVHATFNLGMHVHDTPENVIKNRALLRKYLPGDPHWLRQVHGARHVWIKHGDMQLQEESGDAALSRESNTVCAIMVADCLPVLLCDTAGTIVGAVHAGWRGLAAGIIEQTVAAMQTERNALMAWLGPAIGPAYFEVGEDVRAAFVDSDQRTAAAFEPADSASQSEPKWHADIFQLARYRLAHAGVTRIYGGGVCAYSDPGRFFSYRRDGETGRMAALIWMEKSGEYAK